MKKIITLVSIIVVITFFTNRFFSNRKIEWNSLKQYSADSITFKSNEVKFSCTNCKILEIETKLGITGYFITGTGTIEINKNSFRENVTDCLIRFNPSDNKSYIKINNQKNIFDKDFHLYSMNILKDSFRRTYHWNMNASIPDIGAYSLVFISEKTGEISASFYNNYLSLFSFKTMKEL